MSELSETDIVLVEQGLRGKSREFALCRQLPDQTLQRMDPLDLLTLRRAAVLIARRGITDRELAIRVALCRLLVSCLELRGSGRHLVIESWNGADLRGESLHEDTPIPLAKALAREQADDFREVCAGARPPQGSLGEVFWEVCTDLPSLADSLTDPEVQRFIEALYFHFVPAGTGLQEVSLVTIREQVRAYRIDGFHALPLNLDPRHARRLYRKALAATVQGTSQVAGEVAREMICRQLRVRQGAQAAILSPNEEMVLDFYYGSCPLLGGINVCFLYGIGPMVGTLINRLYSLYVLDAPEAERDAVARDLGQCLHLLAAFRQRRNAARREERHADRLDHSQKPLNGKRRDAQQEADPEATPPEQSMENLEELKALEAWLLPRLSEDDARRVKTLVDADFDFDQAAESLGIPVAHLKEQWQQTIKPNLRQVYREDDRDGKAAPTEPPPSNP